MNDERRTLSQHVLHLSCVQRVLQIQSYMGGGDSRGRRTTNSDTQL